MEDIIEKRKYPRAPIDTEIFVEGTNNQTRQRGKGVICLYASDISVGGIFLESSVSFDVGSEIYLRFKLPNAERPIRLIGKIIRQQISNDNFVEGIGIEFNRISFEDKKIIEEYVKSI
ncbi:MAG: PilZ domain-containing protein [Elusimicrobia bacterium]|nr:PilZ domain-containing protein [Elusimicrobiota bacterium]